MLIFGMGYTASRLAERLRTAGWRVTGTRRMSGEGAVAFDDRYAVLDALERLPDGQVAWYPGADHDIHAQHPARLAQDLLALAARAAAVAPARTEATS